MNCQTKVSAKTIETATSETSAAFAFHAPRQGGKNVKKKISTILMTVAMAGAPFAGPALAYDHDGYNRGRWHATEQWREHHPYPVYAYNRWYPGYRYEPIVPHAGWHWRVVDGHWRWVR
jgi:hypothetical protein